MDNTHKQPTRFMDFAPAKRRPAQHGATAAQPTQAQAPARPQVQAQPRPQLRPQASARPQPSSAQPTRPTLVFRRPTTGATDPLSARPLSRPVSPIRPQPASSPARPQLRPQASTRPQPAAHRQSATQARPQPTQTVPARPQPATRPVAAPAPRIVQSTTVKSVAATEGRVESFEFGIIEDLSPVVKPEPPMIPGSRPAPEPRPTAQPAPEPHREQKSPALFSRKSKDSNPPKSPFLSSVKVPKRPLSASAPTGIHAPVVSQPPAQPAEHPKKKRKNAPFIVIVILSVLLGVSLGAIVYFVLPH